MQQSVFAVDRIRVDAQRRLESVSQPCEAQCDRQVDVEAADEIELQVVPERFAEVILAVVVGRIGRLIECDSEGREVACLSIAVAVENGVAVRCTDLHWPDAEAEFEIATVNACSDGEMRAGCLISRDWNFDDSVDVFERRDLSGFSCVRCAHLPTGAQNHFNAEISAQSLLQIRQRHLPTSEQLIGSVNVVGIGRRSDAVVDDGNNRRADRLHRRAVRTTGLRRVDCVRELGLEQRVFVVGNGAAPGSKTYSAECRTGDLNRAITERRVVVEEDFGLIEIEVDADVDRQLRERFERHCSAAVHEIAQRVDAEIRHEIAQSQREGIGVGEDRPES